MVAALQESLAKAADGFEFFGTMFYDSMHYRGMVVFLHSQVDPKSKVRIQKDVEV